MAVQAALSPLRNTMTKMNSTSIFLFVQSLSAAIQSHAVRSIPQIPNSLPQVLQLILSTPKVVPFEVKFGIFLAVFIVSYLSHRSYLQAKVATLENTVAELYKAVAILETQHEHLKNTVSYNERLATDTADKVQFMFTNTIYLQKALYKKLDFEEKYRDGKKEGTTKNRQQAVQEYMIAEKTVARRFCEV